MSAQHTKDRRTIRRGKLSVIAALLGVSLMVGCSKEPETPKRNVVVNEGNANEFMIELEKREVVPAGKFEVNMNSVWYFPDGASPSDNAYVGNVENNTNDIYFDVELADTGEVIYASPVLPLGSHLKDITLDRDLEAGTYDCVLIYHLIDENQETLSTLRMTLTIIVEG